MDEQAINEIVYDEQQTLDEYNYYVNGYNDAVEATKINKQNWYKSPVVWTSVIALIGLLVVNVFGLIDNELWAATVNVLISLLTVLGVVNNPTNSNGLS